MSLHFSALGRLQYFLMAAVLAGLALGAATASASTSPDALWSDRAESTITRSPEPRRIVPTVYRTLSLDRARLSAVLARTPLESQVAVADSDVRLTLPLADGNFGEFQIVESPIMEPALAARFPEIRTYLGQGIDDRTATLRFDLTPTGFRAQIISWEGTTFIDPFQPGDLDHYISYRKRDAQQNGERMRCLVTGEELPEDVPNFQKRGVAVKLSSGTSLRTYRAAVAATGEYTAFHGGTVALGLAAIVTTMNRVNGIYERELAVRMVLVANNNLIVYTNGGSDPYTNGDPFTMINQNQTNLDTVIGSANYDIGHVVATNSGGLAGLGVVCLAGNKAAGVTGSDAPVGDPFDVDYVAHEIGHQFGGNHTFNGSSCSSRRASTAYETGSGITIQAYAGICGADDVQPNSSDYFHRISLDEMLAFSTTPATGASCGTPTATGNTPPSVTTAAAYTIPRQTPFALTASGNDANGDTLTYLWEQFNLGPANPAGSLTDNGGPLFRNFSPNFSPTRTFPALANILNGSNGAQWELLPSTNRTMNFRVTARDNRAGGGGTNDAATALTVTTSAGPFVVTAPNTAVTWDAGVPQTITWNVANTTAAPVSTATVRISLSLDGGVSFPLVLASGEPNDGSATLSLFGATPTTQARIKVEAENNVYFDISNANFTITGTASPVIINEIDYDQTGADAAEWLELKNISGGVVNLDNYSVELVNGNSGGAAVYDTIDLPNVNLAAGDYFVICANAATVPNCDLDDAPNTDFIQNGAPDAIGLRLSGVLVDAVSYEGNSGAPYTESSGVGLIDSGAVDFQGISRFPDGADTNVNNVDFSPRCITPGLSNATAATGCPNPANPAGVVLTESGGSTNVAEGGATDTYTLVLNNQPTADVSIALNPGAQVTVGSSPVVFTPMNWATAQTVTVTAVDDLIVESAHTGTIGHTVTSPDVAYNGISVPNVVANIADNDSISLAINDVSVTEGNAGTVNATFTVSLSSPAGAGGVTFDIASANNTATTANNDYLANSLTGQTIASGNSTYSFAVLVNGDTTPEANETFFVNVTNVVGANVTDGQGVGTINNDDASADLAITKTDDSVSEVPGTPVTYTIVASNAGPSNVGSATVVDTFPANCTGATWTCAGAGGGSCAVAGSGSINESVNLPVGGSVTYTATCTISAVATGTLANTATVTSSINDPDASNNSATDSDTLITLVSSSPGNEAGWVHYSTRGNSANPADSSCTGCVPAGAVGPAFNEYVTGAATPPLGDGSVSHRTGDGTGGGGATGRGGRLWSTVDDLNGVRLADIGEISYFTYTSPASPDSALKTTIQMYVDLSGDGAAFSFTNGAFPAAPPATNDALLVFEPVHTDGVAAAVQGAWQKWTITQGGGLWWDIRNNAATNSPCSGGCRTLAQIAAAFPNARVYGFSPAQQAAPISGNTVVGAVFNGFLFASGASGGAPWTDYQGNIDSVTFVVDGQFGTIYDFENSLSADLAITKTNGTTTSVPGTSTTYTIVASNAGPSGVVGATVADAFPVSLDCTWVCVGAGGGTCTVTAAGDINDTVNLPSGGSVTYTATCAINRALGSGSLSNTATVSAALTDPNPGNNSATDIDTLTPQADVSITKADGQTSVNAGGSTVYTITASNAGPSDAPSASVSDSFPAACASPTWACVGALGGNCTATNGSGNIAEPVDLPRGGSVTFTATCPINGTATGTLSNTATVTAGVTDPTPGNNSATDTSTIVSVPVLSINSVGLTEGDSGSQNLEFTVTRTTTATAFGVDYATADGSATAGSDYTTTAGTLNFTAGGAATQTINVPITGETLVEGSESFTLALSNATGTAQIGTPVGTGTITDNDSAVVAFNPVGVSQTEGSTPMAFTMTLSNPVQSGVSLDLNSAFGTATAADFTPIVVGTVTFAPNTSANQTVNVLINNDALDEDDETFTLTLSGLTAIGNVTLGAAGATGTIVDDDLPPVISITSPSQPEGNAGNTPMNFVVSLSAVSGRDVSFTRATANGSATLANNDYLQLLPAGATILAGQISLPIAVQIVGDSTFEGNENFRLDLSNIVNATVAVPPLIEGTPVVLTGTGTIEEDDQQPTTTTITSDLPDASVVGQPYTVVVGVAAVSTSPLGTISVSDGTDSCGPVTLTAAAAPTISTASCALTSTTAGAKTLTASYTPASTAFAASSDTEAHQVNAAGTTISVVGPPRSRINQPTTFTFALSVNAPGAGSPAGTVTLSSGIDSCQVTLPTATPSCALNFNTLGSRTVSAGFAPSNGNFVASSSSGAGNAQTLVYAQSDIDVTKTDAIGTFRLGDLLVYTVRVRNLGLDAAAVIRVRDQVPAGVVDVDWTCDASGGVACPAASGSGNLDLTVSAFPVGGLLNFTFFGNVSGSPAQIVNTALVELPTDTTIEDPNLGNNSASDTNLLELLFKNGFEAVAVNAPSGSFRLPSASLRGALDEVAVVVYVLDDVNGEALRVYARVVGSELQYALATRNAQGQLRLGAWASYTGDPLLTWTARQVADGWKLESAELR